MKTLQLLSENWVNGAAITVTSGTQVKAYLCDQRADIPWVSVGSNDTITEVLELGFRNNSGAAALRSLDRILLLNTNVKSMAAYYKDSDGNWQSIAAATITGNTASNLLIELPIPVTASAVKLLLYTTQTGNSDKIIGELKICWFICSVDAWIEFAKGSAYKQGEYYLANGTLVAWREYRKTSGSFSLNHLVKAQRDALSAAFTGYRSLTYVFYADYDLSETYEFALDGEITEEFDRTTERYDWKFKVKEL